MTGPVAPMREEAAGPSGDAACDVEKVAALLAPRNVVIVGASDRPGSWGQQIWTNLDRYGFKGGVFPLNPNRSEIWGTVCHQSYDSLPEPPDHLVILVPARLVSQALRDGAAAGARSATVFTSGFEGHDEETEALSLELSRTIRETGLAVSGPNCFGNISAGNGLVTFLDSRVMTLEPGPVAMIGQSGGVMMFVNRAFEERGLKSSYVVTSGNETGLGLSDYIAFMAQDDNVRAIFAYVESVREPAKFRAACEMARAAGKPIVIMKLGQTDAGRSAAMAHTGSLAGTTEAFDAIAGRLGVIRVDTLDEAAEALEYLVHSRVPKGLRLAAMTLSGAFRGILLDAAAKNGMSFSPLAPATTARLEELVGVGSIVGNPFDGGFAVVSNEETYVKCLEALDADINTDIVLLQEELPRVPGVRRTERYIALVDDFARTRATKPIVFLSMMTHSQSDHSRKLRAGCPNVPFLHEATKALSALKKINRVREQQALALSPRQGRAHPAAFRQIRALAKPTQSVVLNERASKELLAHYGLHSAREHFVTAREEAVAAAERIGFPVVLKVVASALPHKSDVGGVVLDLSTAAEVAEAWDRIERDVRQRAGIKEIEGMLVCEQIKGGLELALGLHRDPEMGLVAMAGAGGVLLELLKDVAFSSVPITPDMARDMLSRTRIQPLLAGFRGRAAHDEAAVVDALVSLGDFAAECGAFIESVDINPLVAREHGQGAVMLDALVVLRPESAISAEKSE